MTMTEVIMALVILSVVSVAFLKIMSGVGTGIQYSRYRTLATNLAQEQVQLLKQRPYYNILITRAGTPYTAYIPDFTPDIPYDTLYYPSEPINEGGISFTRYTYVQAAKVDDYGVIEKLGAVPDTGMKVVTVTVVWDQGGGKKKLQVSSIASNPNMTMKDAIFKGVVTTTDTIPVAIPNAQIGLAENPDWTDGTDGTGKYSLNVLPGNYTVVATRPGFFPVRVSTAISDNQTLTINFQLPKMSSGTIRGSAWLPNPGLVISQVVADAGGGFEYVELFNGTADPIPIAADVATPLIDVVVDQSGGPAPLALNYNPLGLSVPASSYYLIANQPTISLTVNAVPLNVVADAVYVTPGANLLDESKGGAVALCAAGTLSPASDAVWWSGPGSLPSIAYQEGSAFGPVSMPAIGRQFVRRSSTDTIALGGGEDVLNLGRAYDTGSLPGGGSAVDFQDLPVPTGVRPRNSLALDKPAATISGVPAADASVSVDDGLSASTRTVMMGGSPAFPPYAAFRVTSVATGTWTVFLSSGSLTREVSLVNVPAMGSNVLIPNAATLPAWPAADAYATVLSMPATEGYVSGWVRDILGNAIPSGIQVSNGFGLPATADTVSGFYLLRTPPGTFDVLANANNGDPLYISQSSQAVTVALGELRSGVNFTLSQGGRIRGLMTRDGINPVPGLGIVALNANNQAMDQQVSGATGLFTFVNLATGSYTVQPVLGSGEVSTPSSATLTLNGGLTVDVGTFTISGASGRIQGSVTLSGAPIQTGVLIVASSTTFTVPPVISSNTAVGYYMTTSKEDGRYFLDVRGSTTPYVMRAYLFQFNGNTPATPSSQSGGVTVTAGGTVNQDFSW